VYRPTVNIRYYTIIICTELLMTVLLPAPVLATNGVLFCTPLNRCVSVCLMYVDLRIHNVVHVLILE